MSTFDSIVPTYRYFTVDLMTNTVLAEIPFIGVSYERALKSAGSFSGSIGVFDDTAALSLYNNTMPGRTALYVVRNDACVWGGIIWSRSYAASSKTLSVNASEFTSYLHHRNIWKTYSHDFSATAVTTGGSGLTAVGLDFASFPFSAGGPVKLEFYEVGNFQFNGYYTILSPGLSSTTFTVTVPGLPDGIHSNTTVKVRVDTYEYIRALIDEMGIDFSDISFPNGDIQPSAGYSYSITNKQLTGNVATITTLLDHELIPGQSVSVQNLDATFNGDFEIQSVTENTISYAKTATDVASTAVTGVTRTITKKQLTSNVATLTTSVAHGFTAGQRIEISGVDGSTDTYVVFNGSHQIVSIPTFNVTAVTPSSPTAGKVTYTVDAPHSLIVGDTVVVSGTAPAGYNGSFTVTDIHVDVAPYTFSVTNATTTAVTTATGSAQASRKFTYYPYVVSPDIALTTVSGSGTVYPQAISGTYGAYPGYSDIGFDYSTSDYSTVKVDNKTYRGYELRSIGEELDQYSDVIDGFEYRVDCDYDPVTGSFTRTFVFLPINFPNPPAAGEVAPLSRYGADKFVFEYPGNVNEVTIDESAENAATRFFVVGNVSDLGDDISQPYAAATATDLLLSGWPLLDLDETKQDEADEAVLYSQAQRYLDEFRPPVSDIKISINGSISPIVGTYKPGDWCAVIVDDAFVKMRLASDLEIRDTLIVRKIENVKVSVPDGVAFPEGVEVLLIPEWKVDAVGQ